MKNYTFIKFTFLILAILCVSSTIFCQKIYSISGEGTGKAGKEKTNSLYKSGNDLYALYTKLSYHRMTTGYKTKHKLRKFKLFNEDEIIDSQETLFEFTSNNDGYYKMLLHNDKVALINNKVNSKIKLFDISGIELQDLDPSTPDCDFSEFVGVTKSNLYIYKELCLNEIHIYNELGEIQTQIQLEKKNRLYNLELNGDSLMTYTTIKDSITLQLEQLIIDTNTGAQTYLETDTIHKTSLTKSAAFKKYEDHYILTERGSEKVHYRVFKLDNDKLILVSKLDMHLDHSLGLIGFDKHTYIFHQNISKLEKDHGWITTYSSIEKNLVFIKEADDIHNLKNMVNLFNLPMKKVNYHHIIQLNGVVYILTEFTKYPHKFKVTQATYAD